MADKPSPSSISLNRRLLGALIIAMLGALTVTVYSVLYYVDYEAEEVLDARQLKVAESLLRQTTLLIHSGRQNEAWLALETTRGLENAWLTEFQSTPALLFFGKKGVKEETESVKAYIWLIDDEDNLAIGTPMPGYDATSKESRAMHSISRDDHEWRVAELSDESGDHRLYWAQRDDLRNYIAREVANKLILVQLTLIPLVLLALWLAVRRGLNPLSRLSRQITSRHPDNLQPVALKEVPGEVLPVIRAINDLLLRLGLSLGSERSFTANAAHELRGPLAVVRNLSRNMGSAEDLDEVRRIGKQMDQKMSHMAELLSQLLLLAKLDSSVRDVNCREMELRGLIEEVVSEAIPVAEQKSIEISYQAEMEAMICGDRQLLKVMLSNLLSNAIKYERRNGRVAIRINSDGEDLLIQVVDHGPGVETEYLARIFERFYRTDTAKQSVTGTGLGLAIVKRIAELHDAEAWARNSDSGGLQVIIKLPGTRWGSV